MFCRHFWTVLLVAGLAGSSVLAADLSPRQAVIVSVREYAHREFTPLKYTDLDGTRLAVVLRKLGYDVTHLSGENGKTDAALLPTAENIRSRLEQFPAGASKRDVALVVFTGHGLQPLGMKESFFCPQDADPELLEKNGGSVPAKPETLIGVNWALTQIHKKGYATTLVMVDACRDDPRADSIKGGKKSAGIQTVVFDVPDQAGLLLSCSRREYSWEVAGLGGQGAGAFLHHVIEGLEGAAADKQGRITWSRLQAYVEETVPQTVSEKIKDGASQTPSHQARFEGVAVLGKVDLAAARVALVAPPTSLPQPLQPEPTVRTPEPTTVSAGGKQAGERLVIRLNKVEFPLRWCPAITFTYAFLKPVENPEAVTNPQAVKDGKVSPYTHVDSKATVTPPSGFWLGETEVTQEQWQEVMGFAAWKGQLDMKQGDRFPALYVNLRDALDFCDKCGRRKELSDHFLQGYKLRLPTSIEWEYACGAGSPGAHARHIKKASLPGDFGWFHDNTSATREPFAHEVGLKTPNKWGLHDMYGNVSEWCASAATGYDLFNGADEEYWRDYPMQHIGPNVKFPTVSLRYSGDASGGSWRDRSIGEDSIGSQKGASRNLWTGFRVIVYEE